MVSPSPWQRSERHNRVSIRRQFPQAGQPGSAGDRIGLNQLETGLLRLEEVVRGMIGLAQLAEDQLSDYACPQSLDQVRSTIGDSVENGLCVQ